MVGNITVLLTDEKDDSTLQLAATLRSNRMEVKLCAKNGAEVLNIIEETNPDVVVMDAFLQSLIDKPLDSVPAGWTTLAGSVQKPADYRNVRYRQFKF